MSIPIVPMPSAQHKFPQYGTNYSQDSHSTKQSRLFSVGKAPTIKSLKQICERQVDQSDLALASAIESNIPIYDLSRFSPSDSSTTSSLQEEWYQILQSGSGVLVLKNFFPHQSIIDRINVIFGEIITAEASTARGDHFAASGKNARIWNSFQKHAENDVPSFLDFYSNPWMSLISETWLGPGYQITAQVNLVRPGGSPQTCHRDYHLGFQSAESCAAYPKAMQIASQYLTLQGGMAHSSMPSKSGPTRFLPFSQRFEEGYMAYRLPEFQEYFNQNWVSCAMEAGDAVFFNPAIFHAAGENTTVDIQRSANLFQISSAFGKAMEDVDRSQILELCWEELTIRYKVEGQSQEIESALKAIACGYPFPTNLDNRQPGTGGMAPTSQADIAFQGLQQNWSKAEISRALATYKLDSAA